MGTTETTDHGRRDTAQLRCMLERIDDKGWDGRTATDLLTLIRETIARPAAVNAGLRGTAASQAEASAWSGRLGAAGHERRPVGRRAVGRRLEGRPARRREPGHRRPVRHDRSARVGPRQRCRGTAGRPARRAAGPRLASTRSCRGRRGRRPRPQGLEPDGDHRTAEGRLVCGRRRADRQARRPAALPRRRRVRARFARLAQEPSA